MNQHIRYSAFLLIGFSILTSIALSQTNNYSSLGSTAGAPLRMGFGARGIAVGNTLASVIYGELQTYYNPAVAPYQIEPTFIAAYSILSLDRNLNYLSYSKSLKPHAGLSLSVINSGVGNIDGRNRDGLHTDTYSTSENAFIFSFGIKPSPSISLGVSAKILYYYLFEDMKSTSVAIDFGVLYSLTQEITVGAVIQDINAKYNWNSTNLYGLQGNDFADKFPLRGRIGISYAPLWHHGFISGEYESIGSDKLFRVGAEVSIIPDFYLRAGLDQIAVDSDLSPIPSLGFSFQASSMHWKPSFQYSYVFEPYSPSGIHIISFSLRFE